MIPRWPAGDSCGPTARDRAPAPHLAYWQGEDNYNVDVWESEAPFAAFGASRLGPALAKVGVTVEPEVTFHPAHEVFLPAAATITAT